MEQKEQTVRLDDLVRAYELYKNDKMESAQYHLMLDTYRRETGQNEKYIFALMDDRKIELDKLDEMKRKQEAIKKEELKKVETKKIPVQKKLPPSSVIDSGINNSNEKSNDKVAEEIKAKREAFNRAIQEAFETKAPVKKPPKKRLKHVWSPVLEDDIKKLVKSFSDVRDNIPGDGIIVEFNAFKFRMMKEDIHDLFLIIYNAYNRAAFKEGKKEFWLDRDALRTAMLYHACDEKLAKSAKNKSARSIYQLSLVYKMLNEKHRYFSPFMKSALAAAQEIYPGLSGAEFLDLCKKYKEPDEVDDEAWERRRQRKARR